MLRNEVLSTRLFFFFLFDFVHFTTAIHRRIYDVCNVLEASGYIKTCYLDKAPSKERCVYLNEQLFSPLEQAPDTISAFDPDSVMTTFASVVKEFNSAVEVDTCTSPQTVSTNAFIEDGSNFRDETRSVDYFAAEALQKMKKLSMQKKRKTDALSSYGFYSSRKSKQVCTPERKIEGGIDGSFSNYDTDFDQQCSIPVLEYTTPLLHEQANEKFTQARHFESRKLFLPIDFSSAGINNDYGNAFPSVSVEPNGYFPQEINDRGNGTALVTDIATEALSNPKECVYHDTVDADPCVQCNCNSTMCDIVFVKNILSQSF